ncbi:MAG: flagellar hook assembly protein FlgD [Desulfocapsaceae bacterium]|nr:flagellar hook assembly protein FlgD [Desulfocapsaceae bacterium]
MTITPADTYTFPTSKATSTSTTGTSTVAKKDTVMGKDDFLSLLVAQLKNQDPLEPEDPTAFTAQLAQFSSLEQLANLNTTMEGLTTAQANSARLSSLSLIGKDITYNGSTVTLEGKPVEIGYQLDGTASSVTLSIQDANGKTVRTIQAADTELKAGNHFISWDGKDQEGNLLANGKYTLVLQASAAGEGASIAAAPLVRSVVTGIDLSSGIITTRAGEVLFKNIIGVMEPNSNTLAAATLTNTTNTTTTTGTTPTTSNEQTAQRIIDEYILRLRQH